MFNFRIKHKAQNSQARTGIISTSHGKINTPAFIPVATQATVKALTPIQLEEIGFEAVLCNTYHLYLRPGAALVKKMGGLQKFMAWNKPLFTDSGGFQVFSLKNGLCEVNDDGVTFKSHIDASKHIFTPEKSMQIQRKLGADLIFAFDQCLALNADYETTKKSLERTHAWAVRSLREFKRLNKDKKQALYGIVQGGRFLELRQKSAKFISSLGFDAIGIGSIFGDPKDESRKIVEHTLKFLPPGKPKHLLGIGAVEDIFTYVEMGMDTFDCVLPTRLARVGYIYIRPESGGKPENKFRYRITTSKFKSDKKPLDGHCDCYVCQNFSRAYLHHLFKAEELLSYTLATYHNLYFFARMMREIRESIEKDKFRELKRKWVK
ncbi:tRNA guanosine(34) transglycosylase Tgt [Candidatus Woesearchaeota archaeon]|nr:tRNA guanosine(34) transglycosylase Tgt [Candidatus Woesearchaeota archaeon]